MIINVVSSGGRTHMLDTARELERYGHIVRFYSFVPTKRAIQYGLKKECSYTLFYWALPFLILFKIFGFKRWCITLYQRFFDNFLCFYMGKCDIIIGQSPLAYKCMKRMKSKYGSIAILERGTSHILEQIKNLEGAPKSEYPNTFIANYRKKIDLEGYNVADYISVGSEHVKDSFIKHGFKSDSIFVNNYGCDLSQFCATPVDYYKYDIIQVGQWGFRKGADLITKVCQKRGLHFLHVGAITDIPFPFDIKCMKHVDPVRQSELINYYKLAKCFVMPSREEGLAMVQVQALACGLPLVCSKNSGGEDLNNYTMSKDWIIVMESLTEESLEIAIDQALILANKQNKIRKTMDEEGYRNISWNGYGVRYNEFLKKVTQKNGKN